MTEPLAQLRALIRKSNIASREELSEAMGDPATRVIARTTVDARSVVHSASVRNKIQADPRRRGPRFNGFDQLLARLSDIPENRNIVVTTVLAPDAEIVCYSDESLEHLYGVVEARFPNAQFFRNYVDERTRLAYIKGFEDGRSSPDRALDEAPQHLAASDERPDVYEANNELEAQARRAIASDESRFGPHAPTIAWHLIGLGHVLRNSNRLAEAEDSYVRAIAIMERSGDTQLAAAFSGYAAVLKQAQRLGEAEAWLRRALAIHRDRNERAEIALALSELAGMLSKRQEFVEAERYYREAIEIYESSYGPKHPFVAREMLQLADLLCSTRRFAEGELYYRRALALFESRYGRSYSEAELVRDRLNNIQQVRRKAAEGPSGR